MTSLLLLAQELFERATNPSYGVASNDEHTARLAAVLGADDVERFTSEVARLDDPTILTSYGWTWVLEFAIGHDIRLDRRLLTDLCQRWDEPALKALVIEAAIDADDTTRSGPNADEWIMEVINRAAPLQARRDNRSDDGQIDRDESELSDGVDTSSAEALLTALLIVGTDPALTAARQLLGRRWPGAAQLANFMTARLNDPDPLSRAPWETLQG